MKYPIAFNSWQQEEYLALMSVLGSDKYTCGERVAEFESLFCEMFGYNYAVMTNSGSSANLLITAAMVYGGFLERDSTIIVPAIAWSTSYAPFIQFGMKLKVVDVDIDTLGYDYEALKKAGEADAILIVNMFGNPRENNWIESRSPLFVIDDNCEAMGTEPSKSLCSSFSMFYSHHISTMEGGIAVTANKELYEIMLSLRAHGWDKDHNFIYPGYNVRPTEIAAAVGLTQLARFPEILDGYQRNALFFQSIIGKIPGIKIQKEIGKSSWMGFYIFIEDSTAEEVAILRKILESVGIETRPIMCCFHKQPMAEFADYEICGELTNAEQVFERGFYVGNSNSDIRKQIISLDARLRDFMKHERMKNDLHLHSVRA